MSKKLWMPDIVGFSGLFSESCDAEESSVGFPDESCVLLAGTPGSGKTIVAFSLVRSLMRNHRNSVLCYISTEIDKKKLSRDFESFGWFSDGKHDGIQEDTVFAKDRVILPHMPDLGPYHEARGASSLVDLVLRQTKQAVDEWGRSCSGKRTGRTEDDENIVFVIVDSLTAILKDSKTAGERRAQADRCIKNLCNTAFPGRLALLFVLSEQSSDAKTELEVPPEEYLADVVFRLGARNTGSGCRLRTLEITKARGARMLIGEHSFSIVTKQGINDVIAQRQTKRLVKKSIGKERLPSTSETDRNAKDTFRWATIIVAPRTHLPSIGRENKLAKASAGSGDDGLRQEGKSDRWLSIGTPGLDAMLRGQFRGTRRYFNNTNNNSIPGLQQGTTTLVLGGTGTGKTTVALQFLLQHGRVPNGQFFPTKLSKTLYVNFENPPKQVIEKFPGSMEAKSALRNCEYLFRHCRNLDINLLLLEIANAVSRRKIRRVVVDGLSDLLRTMGDEQDFGHVVEALLRTIKQAGGRGVTTLVTYEMPPDLSAFSPPTEGLSVASDNIVVLCHRSISNELRKTVWILKARRQQSDRQVREVFINPVVHTYDPPLEVRSGRLELYSNLLSGQPRSIRAMLHFFAENAAERAFNEHLVQSLRERFGRHLVLESVVFSTHELAGTLREAISAEKRVTPSDLSIISLDEWWVREYGEEQRRMPRQASQLFDLNDLFVSPEGSPTNRGRRDLRSDFWAFEVEKASLVHRRSGQGNEQDDREDPIETLAVPNYQDYGLFCVNRELWHRYIDNQSNSLRMTDARKHRDEWVQLLRDMPRVWSAISFKGKFVEPLADPSQPPQTLVDLLNLARLQHERRRNAGCELPSGEKFIGFAFDMETPQTVTCVFLELCWSFGAGEDFLVRDVLKVAKRKVGKRTRTNAVSPRHPALLALRFLQYLVTHQLMPARTNLEDCKRSLFSRQWYSTLCAIALDHRAQRQNCGELADHDDVSPLFPTVFFPIGSVVTSPSIGEPPVIRRALGDAYGRFKRTAERVLATLQYRLRSGEADGVENSGERVVTKAKHIVRDVANAWNEYSGKKALTNSQFIAELKRLADELEEISREAPCLMPSQFLCNTAPTDKNAPPDDRVDRDLWEVLPTVRSLDRRDISEMLRGHRFRMELIDAELEGRSLADVVCAAKPHSDRGSRTAETSVSALTGYAASGSWLVGGIEPIHSPGVAWNMMEEITSLANARKRAQFGAGIPARKDFIEFHGNDSVTHAEHLTWSELFKFAGSRARRRDRTICAACSISSLTALIDRQVRYCLSMAADCPTDNNRLDKIAVDAVEEIRQHLFEQMKNCVMHNNSRVCIHESECRRLLENSATRSSHPPDGV